jgi:hypothetical protein
MKVLKFTGKSKSEKYTTIRVKTSDLDRIKKAFGEKNMTSTWHDIFTQMTNTCCETILKLWVRILSIM